MHSDAFFRFINPTVLYTAALIFGIITFFIVLTIYIFLHTKKRRFRTRKLVEEQLNEWISDALTDPDLPALNIPPDVERNLNKRAIRQFITDNLINIKKNVTGSIAENLVTVYDRLDLRKDSVNNLKSLAWHRRARGIYELYMMGQEAELTDILDYTNSANEYVRMEAQTAIISFSGFEGLVFLDKLTHPINEWQQIKLLEQLNAVNPGPMPHLPQWLASDNKYVAHFALRLTEIYQQFEMHDSVVACLQNDSEKIRLQAIKTLGSIPDETTVDILKLQYAKEGISNRKAILTQLIINGAEQDVDFLLDKLQEEDDSLKLEAMRAIYAISKNSFSMVEHNAADDTVLTSIIRQIKQEQRA